MVADRLAIFMRDRPLVLDRQIGNACPGVELIGRGKGPGRAYILTGGTTAAKISSRRRRLQFQCGIDSAEEQPAAVIAADDIGMLALPAQTGGLRQRLFHHRRGVDKDLYLALRLGNQPAGGALQRALDHIMIILALRIDRYAAVIPDALQRKRIGSGRIAHAQHDHRLDIRP